MVNTMDQRETVSLREWVNLALDSIDISDEPLLAFGGDPRTFALSSDDFLISGLKVRAPVLLRFILWLAVVGLSLFG